MHLAAAVWAAAAWLTMLFAGSVAHAQTTPGVSAGVGDEDYLDYLAALSEAQGVPASSLGGPFYFAAVTGDDAHAGTDPAFPLHSFAKVREVCVPGVECIFPRRRARRERLVAERPPAGLRR